MMFLGDARGNGHSPTSSMAQFDTSDKVRTSYKKSRKFIAASWGGLSRRIRKSMSLTLLTQRTKVVRKMRRGARHGQGGVPQAL